jgi:protein-tyrosine-phosphatase/predicted ATP-grasp superfamily ATP-dependent carboligase
VHGAAFDFCSPALRSRYIASLSPAPRHHGNGAQWVRDFRELLDGLQCGVVIPCDERSLLPLHFHRHRFADCRLAPPEPRALEVLFDKWATRDLAQSLGIAVAAGRLLRSDERPATLIAEFGLPLLLKPRRSYSMDDLARRHDVAICADERAVAEGLRRIGTGGFVEQFFDGRAAGVSILAVDGRVEATLQHQRLHELAGGGSSYRESVPVSPELERACGKMVAALRYTGLAMFEFRIRGAGREWILLEVNARPWGSLPLAVAAGLDLPFLWYRSLIGKMAPTSTYGRVGLRARNLSLDLDYVRTRELTACGPAERLRRVIRYAAGYGPLATGRESLDSWAFDDPAPGFRELAHLARQGAMKAAPPLPGAGALRRLKAARLLRGLAAGGASRRRTVMFVCQGNVYRSPFAERLFTARASMKNLEGWNAESCGLDAIEGRASPAEALEAALEYGVELRGHTATPVSWAGLRNAALIVTFDKPTARAIRCRFPPPLPPLLLLGDLLLPPRDIADPVDAPRSLRDRYKSIESALSSMLDLLRHDLG